MIGASIGVVLFLVIGFVAFVMIPMMFRVVVPTNEVHIVQTGGSTVSYGKDTENGNSYYKWPTWIPKFGVVRTVMPVSVFDIDLKGYEAYDRGRLPFLVDIKAFFRISDSNKAAQRVATSQEMKEQLTAIVQGAVRKILASNEIEEIMEGRGKFSDEFTDEVKGQLSNWGVDTVKNIELMDIRDSKESSAIANIMAKKQSLIEMESRTAVATNNKKAEMAEIDARREVDMQAQDAKQQVGLRVVQTEREVEIAKQVQLQQVKEQAKITTEKEMDVRKVQETRQAEITKDVEVVKAKQMSETQIIKAEADRKSKTIIAETEKTVAVTTAQGQLESKTMEAKGIELTGKANAEAEQAMLMAPVEAQTRLAKEIGTNAGYQKYLTDIRKVEAAENVGKVQAEALKSAKINVVANSGSPSEGLDNVMDLFTSKGGTAIGTMLQGLANTEEGKKLVDKVIGGDKTLPEKEE